MIGTLLYIIVGAAIGGIRLSMQNEHDKEEELVATIIAGIFWPVYLVGKGGYMAGQRFKKRQEEKEEKDEYTNNSI